MSDKRPLLGGVELGGTKCICLLGTGPDDIRTQLTIRTGADPGATLQHIEDVLQNAMALHGPIERLGIACFGPLDLDLGSASYGAITTTPKPGWQNTQIAMRLQRRFGVPVAFDTDVNGAALAEGSWGAARGLADFAYITIGTGVGVGLIVNGRPVHGFAHPELGHIRIARRAGDAWPGSCPFHGDCVEGLLSGTAIAARTGAAAEALPADSPVWELVSHALSQLLHTLVLATAPRRILVGGGVIAARPELLLRARQLLVESLQGYSAFAEASGGIEQYLVPPALGTLAGPLGALALASSLS